VIYDRLCQIYGIDRLAKLCSYLSPGVNIELVVGKEGFLPCCVFFNAVSPCLNTKLLAERAKELEK
jgi:hypothetical protein